MAKDTKNTAKTDPKPAVAVDWHNDTQTITINTVDDAPESFEAVTVQVMAGRTTNQKRAAWRVKGFVDNAEHGPALNVAKLFNDILRAKFDTPKHHDVKSAVEQFSFPELGDDKGDDTDWTAFENADMLRDELAAANTAATDFLGGEVKTRASLQALGQHIAAVANSLENNKAWAAWVASGSADLQKAMANKNAKAEFCFVGKLPRLYFDALPDGTTSPKSVQRHFNVDKNSLAEKIADAVWTGKREKMPSAGQLTNITLDVLSDCQGWADEKTLKEDPMQEQLLARAFMGFLDTCLDGGKLAAFSITEGEATVAKDKGGNYVAETQFGTGNRPHELIRSVAQAVNAKRPDVVEERERDKAAAVGSKARKFTQFSPKEAALHLLGILIARESEPGDIGDVLDIVNATAGAAADNGWTQALADLRASVSAEAAAQAEAEAEDDADDEA